MKTFFKKSLSKAVPIALIASVCFFVLLFSACNGSGNATPDGTYALYYKIAGYDENARSIDVDVYITKSDDTKLLENAPYFRRSRTEKGFWFNTNYLDVTVDSSMLYSALDAALTPDERQINGETYSDLKVFLRYDTIYKSYVSNGERTREGRTYIHKLALADNGESASFALSREYPNSANWYAVLLGGALPLGVIATAVMVLTLKKKRKAPLSGHVEAYADKNGSADGADKF